MPEKNMMPFHLFYHQEKPYVINIEGMDACAVAESTAQVLTKMGTEPELIPPLSIEEDLKKIGLISEDWQEIKKPVKRDCTPITNICLFLTQSCNLKCVYCYGDGGGYGTGGHMEDKTAFQAVDWLIEQSKNMKRIHIGFFGGEPFLKFSLMKLIVTYAEKRAAEADKEVDFHCTTNATLLDDEQIAFIIDHNLSVMISIDGPREIHDVQRPYTNGKGSYDSVVPKIKKLLALRPDTPGHAVMVGNNDPQRVKSALQEIGFTKISIIPASQSLFAGDPNQKNSKRDTSNFLDILEQEAETWIKLTQSRNSQDLEILKAKSGLYFGLAALFQHKKNRHACSAGLAMVGVSVTGDVYLCHRFVGMENYKIGSVFQPELNREMYLESPATSNERCIACLAKYYCAGGCKHDNVGSCGSIATPSEDICRIRCRELELAASILCRLSSEDQAFLVEHCILVPKPCPLDF